MKYFFWPARSGTPSLLRRRQSALPCLIRRAVFHMISAGLLSICVLLGFLNYVSHASFFLPNYLIVLVLVCCSPVVGCRNLSDKEWFSRQDPYVVVEYANNRFRTRTDTDGGKNPTFNEKFQIPLIEGLREINVQVWNSNTVSLDDHIGSCKVLLDRVLSSGYDNTAWALKSKHGKTSGEVNLILHYAGSKKDNHGAAHGQTSSSGYPPQMSGYPPPPPAYGAPPAYPPAPAPYPSGYAPQPVSYQAPPQGYPPVNPYPAPPTAYPGPPAPYPAPTGYPAPSGYPAAGGYPPPPTGYPAPAPHYPAPVPYPAPGGYPQVMPYGAPGPWPPGSGGYPVHHY